MGSRHLKWSFNLSTRLAELEDAHRELDNLFDRILQACENDTRVSTVGERIRSFLTYARWHFVEEEHLMSQLEYRGYMDHKADHQRLLRDAGDFVESFGGAPRSEDSSAIVSYFKYWLTRHMIGHDSDLLQFLNTLKTQDG